MNRLLGIIFMWMATQIMEAQTCDIIIEGNPISCVDVSGLKQGIWTVCEGNLSYCLDRRGMLSLIATGDYKDDL